MCSLSRAREGLYLIGNSLCLREGGKRSGLWDKILDTLDDKLGVTLPLVCQNHPHKITNVSCAVDFKKVSWRLRLTMWSSETLWTHLRYGMPYFNHDGILRARTVTESESVGTCYLRNNTKLRKKCFERCGDCEFSNEGYFSVIFHKMDIPCCIEPLHILCREKCSNTLPCGHTKM